MSISDGVLANAANFNAAFESKNKNVVSKTSNYTATDEDFLINCNATGGAFTITLPNAASNSGKIYEIYKTDSSANAVTIDANASELISGFTTKTLSSQYHGVLIICDGTGWVIKSEFQGNILTYSKNADYTVLAYDQFVRSDNTGGNIIFTLPALSSVPNGKKFFFRRGAGALGNITTISRSGSDVISNTRGASVNSVIMATPGETLELTAISGSSWFVTNRYIYSGWQSYTPTWSTAGSAASIGNGTITGFWRRVGESIDLNVTISMGSTTTFGTSDYYLSIPSGLTLDFTKTAIGSNNDDQICGYGLVLDSGATRYFIRVVPENSTKLKFHYILETGGNPTMNSALTATAPITFASGDRITFKASFPITNWEG